MTSTVEHEVITPTAGKALRRLVFWIAAALFAVLIAVASFVMTGAQQEREALDPQSPTPSGAQAVLRVLEQQGVTVTIVDSLTAAENAVGAEGTTTLVLHDAHGILTDAQLEAALSLSDRTVVIDPVDRELAAITPDVTTAGPLSTSVDAACTVGAADRAGTVEGGGSGYEIEPGAGNVVGCFQDGDDHPRFGLVVVTADGAETVLFGITAALRNDTILRAGNAAVSLGVFGERSELVWYRPGPADLGTGELTPAELSPRWVVPVALTLVLTVIAAGLWQGRRFGPLVVENLPVVVRASETMEGRARLYGAASARLRALDALRIGTLDRLAPRLGLASSATVDEIVLAIAELLDRPPAEVAAVLHDTEPHTDRELIELSDALLRLDTAVADALRA